MIYVLGGGANFIDKHPAGVIHVVYPQGSTCTCSNNGKILTAPNTLGAHTFYLPSTGSWTVACTDGTNSVNKVIDITTTENMVEVQLEYVYYLFNNGSISNIPWTTNNMSQINSTFMYLQIPNASNDGLLVTTNFIQLKDFKQLKCKVNVNFRDQDIIHASTSFHFGLATNKTANTTFTKSTKFIANNLIVGDNILSVDISNYQNTNNYYVKLFGSYTDGWKFKEIYLDSN